MLNIKTNHCVCTVFLLNANPREYLHVLHVYMQTFMTCVNINADRAMIFLNHMVAARQCTEQT